MRFITALQTIALLAASATAKGWNRLDKENAVFPFALSQVVQLLISQPGRSRH
jgi:hypothetical protein